MSTLIDQLTQLQTALTKLRDKYQFASSELTRIKAQPTITADQLQAVQAKLDSSKELQQSLDATTEKRCNW